MTRYCYAVERPMTFQIQQPTRIWRFLFPWQRQEWLGEAHANVREFVYAGDSYVQDAKRFGRWYNPPRVGGVTWGECADVAETISRVPAAHLLPEIWSPRLIRAREEALILSGMEGKVTRYWYALELRPVPNGTLLRPARVHRFTSRAVRQRWLGCGGFDTRLIAESDHKAVRWANRTRAWGKSFGAWGIRGQHIAILPAALVARWQ